MYISTPSILICSYKAPLCAYVSIVYCTILLYLFSYAVVNVHVTLLYYQYKITVTMYKNLMHTVITQK